MSPLFHVARELITDTAHGGEKKSQTKGSSEREPAVSPGVKWECQRDKCVRVWSNPR
jgi:hypothetical protein